MRALSASAHMKQRIGDAEGGIEAGCEIRKRHAAFDGCASRLAGHAHDAAHGLQRQIEAGLARARSFLAEGGDGAVHEIGLCLAQRRMVEAKTRHDAGSVVLEHDLRGGDEVARPLVVARILEIERDRALVAVHRGEVLAVAVLQRRPLPHGIAAIRVLDLDDVRTHVREQHAAEGARRDAAELHNSYACE